MITVTPFENLGTFKNDWLDAHYHFSFADYRDPATQLDIFKVPTELALSSTGLNYRLSLGLIDLCIRGRDLRKRPLLCQIVK